MKAACELPRSPAVSIERRPKGVQLAHGEVSVGRPVLLAMLSLERMKERETKP